MSTAVELRAPMRVGARRVRAYCAPVERNTSSLAPFVLERDGSFDLTAPPAGWFDLGWIDQFTRSSATRHEALPAGMKGAPAAQFRARASARVELVFREWGKLQMALAGGTQHMNLLAADLEADPSGATPRAAVPVLAGSSASLLVVGAGAVNGFDVGDLVAVDVDYADEVGYIGTGVAGAYVKDAAAVHHNVNYVRRVTLNVARVKGKTSDALQLSTPMVGGAPAVGAAVQQVAGFCDREGGSFFQEWSLLFVIAEELGGRVCFYYPRVQPCASAAEAAFVIAEPLRETALKAAFLALPTVDARDSEQVLCYRAYFPAASAAAY